MLYSSDRLAYLIPSRRMSRPTLCITLDPPQFTHPAMSSLPEVSTSVSSKMPSSSGLRESLYKRLLDYGYSAIAKSKEMEISLNTVESLPSDAALEAEAIKLMRLAAEFISEHIAMHVTSRGVFDLPHGGLANQGGPQTSDFACTRLKGPTRWWCHI